jgi:carbon starvation protein
MNALTLIIIAGCIFALAYRYYSYFITTKVLVLDPKRPTPASELNDNIDYVPTNKYVLFGHHFAAISGAGPLIGPVLAAQFGFLPGFLWIVIGSVVAGSVHDLVILFASVRSKGRSLSEIARKQVSRTTGIVSSLAIFIIIITCLAGLAIAVVNALNESPWGAFTIGATIPIALFIGVYMQVLRPGRIVEASILGSIMIILAVIFGHTVQQSSLGSLFLLSKKQLSVALPLYGFLASVLPVWMLLTPRDYLSSYMKIGTILMLITGIFLVRPEISMPAFTPFISGHGPIIPGKVWPFVCITIACGAISGFHALISTGTTPKMVSNERDIRMIGYGAMLTESIVSIMALIAATVLIPADYFAINCSPEAFQKIMADPRYTALLNSSQSKLSVLSAMMEERIAGRPGGAVSLAVGMAYIFSSLPGMKTLMSYWYHFAIMFEALFILTTVDAGTRVARYLTQEFLGKLWRPLARSHFWPGIILTSFIVSFAWGYLVYTGDISTIWPMFGVANQLLATLSLAVSTTLILKNASKKWYALLTFLPMTFMLATTVTAGSLNIFTNYLPQHTFQGNLNAIFTALMILLVVIAVVECGRKWISLLQWRKLGSHLQMSIVVDRRSIR